jgi:hypothetical protein
MKTHLTVLGWLATVAFLAASAAACPTRAGVAATRAGFGIERVAYATSTNGSTWTKQGVVLNRSLTFAALPRKVVFGKAVKLSGLLTEGGAAVGGQPVTVYALPLGSSGFTNLATVTTSTTGAYSTTSMPQKQTVYQAFTDYVDRCCFVTVKVAQLLTLSALPKGGKVYVKGRLAPEKPGRVIVIQVRSGKRWKVLARVKTSRRSTFKAVRALNPGQTYHFRATTRGYPGLLSGASRTLRLRK